MGIEIYEKLGYVLFDRFFIISIFWKHIFSILYLLKIHLIKKSECHLKKIKSMKSCWIGKKKYT